MAHQRPADAQLLDRAVQVVGAIAGFGLLIYAVGASIMWLRFATTGFNADEALALVSRDRLAFLGFRYLVGWVLAVAVLLLAIWRITLRLRSIEGRGGWEKALRGNRGTRLVYGSLGVVLAASAFVTWSVFTVAADLAATVLFIRWYIRPGARRTTGQLVLFVAVLSALSAIGWQLEINLPYDRATFYVTGEANQLSGIYLGEAADEVFLAVRPPGRHAYERAISIYPRSEVRSLQIVAPAQSLCTRVDRPIIVFVDEFDRIARIVRQHTSRTGQPVVTTAPKQQNLPIGQCPALR